MIVASQTLLSLLIRKKGRLHHICSSAVNVNDSFSALIALSLGLLQAKQFLLSKILKNGHPQAPS